MSERAGLRWTKSSLSQVEGCVEWAAAGCGNQVYVRDSKDPTGPVLRFTRREWDAFVAGAKRGEADLEK